MEDLTAHVSRVVKAPIDKVFRAWVEADQLKQWYSPEGMSTPKASVEARKGGKYSVTMQMGEAEFDMSGEYLEFDEPNKLVFTWNAATSIVIVNFKKVDETTTEVSLTHRGFVNEKSQMEHQQGWDGTLNKLVKYF